jgi:hypothetical protein
MENLENVEHSELRVKIKDLAKEFSSKIQDDECGGSIQSVLVIVNDGETTSCITGGSMHQQLVAVTGVAKQDDFLKKLLELATIYLKE